jgi:hypothetical protein
MCAARRPRLAWVVFLLGLTLVGSGLLTWGCSSPPQPPESTLDEPIGVVDAYFFEPDAQHYLSAPHPFPLDPAMTVEDALAALAGHLSRTYFNRTPGGDPPIHFEIVKVYRLALPQRVVRVAVINMIDPQLEALQVFFQGSAGGQTTYYMLTATLFQPQLTPPLVDGLILLYNGDAFPEIDHVNLRGIVTPQAARAVVSKALFRYGKEGPATTG